MNPWQSIDILAYVEAVPLTLLRPVNQHMGGVCLTLHNTKPTFPFGKWKPAQTVSSNDACFFSRHLHNLQDMKSKGLTPDSQDAHQHSKDLHLTVPFLHCLVKLSGQHGHNVLTTQSPVSCWHDMSQNYSDFAFVYLFIYFYKSWRQLCHHWDTESQAFLPSGKTAVLRSQGGCIYQRLRVHLFQVSHLHLFPLGFKVTSLS